MSSNSTPAWQQGHDLQFLKSIRALFARYEPFSFGRFSIPNESQIAGLLSDGQGYVLTADELPVAFMAAKIARRDSIRRDFAGRKLFVKQGDFQIHHLTYIDGVDERKISDYLLQYAGNRSVWAEIHTEDWERVALLQRLGFQRVATKISASSELLSIMLRSNRPAIRVPEALHPAERATLTKLWDSYISPHEISEIRTEVANGIDWADHYSSYNVKHSWSAISLRGYSDDPGFIIKPAEMSKRWKEENADMIDAHVRDTEMMARFPTVQRIMSRLGTDFQRVRLMRVRAGDGELTRHADITDREAGPMPGQIARLHIPITSHEACRFQAWDLSGSIMQEHLPEGSLWYLDTRKPHAVSNRGASFDRIHLVLDAVCNSNLTGTITRAA